MSTRLLAALPILALSALAATSTAQLGSHATWVVGSGQDGSNYGWSVAGAGDVNGDGYADALVGAPLYTNGQTWEGRAYLYLGSPTGLPISPAWTAEANLAFASFGSGVAGAGDVNGDGYADVVIGAGDWSNGENFEGKAFVHLGSAAGLSPNPSWAVESNIGSAHFGQAVAGAGDVNGDGYDDVLIGSTSPGVYGSATLYLGSATGLAPTPAWTVPSPQGSSSFGRSVAGIGDVNGDGYADIAVGASNWSTDLPSVGAVLVYLGSPVGPGPVADAVLLGDSSYSLYGHAVNGAGDVDGDGYDDLVVGAGYYDVGMFHEGRAFLYRGSAAGLETVPSWMARPFKGGSDFGIAVDGAGDVNGDGYDDLLIGADFYREEPFAYGNGRVFVYLGGPQGPDDVPDWFGGTTEPVGYLGAAVAGAGDVNGDGYDDAIAGGQNGDSGVQGARGYLGGTWAAQAPYGAPKASGFPPRLTSLAAPVIGGTATLDLYGGASFATGVFAIVGLQPASLPFDAATLSVLPFQVLFLPKLDFNGHFSLSIELPVEPALQGSSLFFQAGYVSQSSPGPHHTVLSNALHWTFGD